MNQNSYYVLNAYNSEHHKVLYFFWHCRQSYTEDDYTWQPVIPPMHDTTVTVNEYPHDGGDDGTAESQRREYYAAYVVASA